VPAIAGIAPAGGLTADAGTQSSPQMLTINGSNFVGGSSVLWNGLPLAGVSVAAGNSQITVPVPASSLRASGTAALVVSNPAPGGGNSNTVIVDINPPTPAAPLLAPVNAAALSGGFELQVTATNVLANSVIVWNYGSPLAQPLNTRLTTPPSSGGGSGTLTAVVPNSLIAATGAVPVAVANPNADGTVTTAVSGDASFTVNGEAVAVCLLGGAGSLAPQFRNYAFVATGTDMNGAAAMSGSFRVDATNAVISAPLPNIVNSEADFKDAANLFVVDANNGRMSSAAGRCKDNAAVPGTGSVQFTVNSIPGDTFTLNYALRANGFGGRITLTDTLYGVKATGQIQIQFSTNAFNVGSFAFGLLGANAAGSRYGVIGAMCTSQPAFLQADFNDAATGGMPSMATAGAWSLAGGDATTGRTTTTELSFSNGRSLMLTLYGVGGGKAYAIESSPIATSKQVLSGVVTGFKGPICLASGNGGSFSNSTFTNSVFGLSAESAGSAGTILGVVTNVAAKGGGSCAAGQGSASLTADENENGTTGIVSAAPACYSVSGAGRASLTYTDPNTHKVGNGIFYLDGGGNGYLLGEGALITYGFVAAQLAPPLPALGGNYSFAPFTFPAGLLPASSVAVTSTTITDHAAGGSATTGPYSLDATTGRGVASLDNANTFGSTQLVFYEASGRQVYVMDQSGAAPIIGALIQ
jgi:hypothetical protein